MQTGSKTQDIIFFWLLGEHEEESVFSFRKKTVIPYFLQTLNYYLLGTIWPTVHPETQRLILKSILPKRLVFFFKISLFSDVFFISYN